MNCPSRNDDTIEHEDWNQSPAALAADLTTREDLNGTVNRRTNQDSGKQAEDTRTIPQADGAFDSRFSLELARRLGDEGRSTRENDQNNHISFSGAVTSGRDRRGSKFSLRFSQVFESFPKLNIANTRSTAVSSGESPTRGDDATQQKARNFTVAVWQVLKKFLGFIGPGFLVAVAYIDPGNYSTDVAAGVATRFKLLFIVLMSNIFAIVLQSLAIRLGTVTGMNLAEHCRAHFPRWLNLLLYVIGEAAIIATDIAEVIGSAIALNLLIKVPLAWGCVITVVDVLVILIFYSSQGSMKRLHFFEYFVIALVLGVVICFCIELSFIHRHAHITVGEVFKGYLPSSTVVDGQGIYLSCGILGATVMPHSLYLGSGMVQSRLLDFDRKAGNEIPEATESSSKNSYRPSLAAINSCMSYSIAEVCIALFTFALFVNSAILIVAGASLSSNPSAEDANLFGVHDLLSSTLAPVAGTLFALALLLSGTSAGIVCTIAGQLLSEGALNWKIPPWLRRLLTRSISIIPSIIIAGSVGKKGLSATLNATQVALSVALPFVSAPLIYFTCRNKYMVVGGTDSIERAGTPQEFEVGQVSGVKKMRNHWLASIIAVLIWLIITIMNVALLVLLGLGKA
ncbi:NRAMP-like transporter smf-3 [Lecanora helva]